MPLVQVRRNSKQIHGLLSAMRSADRLERRMKILLEIDKDLLKKSFGKMAQVNDSLYICLLTDTWLKDEDGDHVYKSPLLEWYARNADKKTLRDLVSDEDIERWMNGEE